MGISDLHDTDNLTRELITEIVCTSQCLVDCRHNFTVNLKTNHDILSLPYCATVAG